MSRVEFHTDVEDPLDYACRLLRRASRQRVRVAVAGAPETLVRLDLMLWTFDSTSFVAHRRIAVDTPPSRASRTGIWLLDEEAAPPEALGHPEILLNLGDRAVADPGPWPRIIEIVPADAGERERARQRWRDYKAAGLSPSYAAIHQESV